MHFTLNTGSIPSRRATLHFQAQTQPTCFIPCVLSAAGSRTSITLPIPERLFSFHHGISALQLILVLVLGPMGNITTLGELHINSRSMATTIIRSTLTRTAITMVLDHSRCGKE